MYREIKNYENQQKYIFDGVGQYGIPKIEPTSYKECEFIGFNYANTCKKPEGKGIHFFLDDYQFLRLWTHPDKYIPMLSKFDCVMSPDFSTYTDFPKALQIYNHFRKHWLGAYMQMYGIDVIPTISWSDRESFDWCFDGEPVGSAVAVSSVGVMNSKERKALFMDGYREMMDRLQPETVLFYGQVPEECTGNIVKIKSFGEEITERKRGK